MEYIQHKSIWFPGSVRVAGRRLRPMTLGQLRLLEAVSSPFILGGPVDAHDLAIALWCLSRSWRRPHRALRRLAAAVARRTRPSRSALLALRWQLSARRLRPHCTAIATALQDYIADNLWTPERFEEAGSGSSFAPASGLTTRLALRAASLDILSLRHTPRWRTIWDIPIQAICTYSVADQEASGAEYLTRAELEAIQSTPTSQEPHHA